MRTNRQIRVPRVRLIDHNGDQVGIVLTEDAFKRAKLAGLDLVEMVPNASPPVCKILDYGKYRYEQGKREKEKSQHQTKVKELKLRPNTDRHDLDTKIRHAREFLEKGNKVKVTCKFRGREIVHKELGKKLLDSFCEQLAELAIVEAQAKLLGNTMTMVLAPNPRRKKQSTPSSEGVQTDLPPQQGEISRTKDEDEKSGDLEV